MILEDQYGVGDVVDVGRASGHRRGGRSAGDPAARRQRHGLVRPQRRDPRRRQHEPELGSDRARHPRRLQRGPRPGSASILREVAHEVWEDPEYRPDILEEPEVWGVERWDPDGVVVRVVLKTAPLQAVGGRPRDCASASRTASTPTGSRSRCRSGWSGTATRALTAPSAAGWTPTGDDRQRRTVRVARRGRRRP